MEPLAEGRWELEGVKRAHGRPEKGRVNIVKMAKM